MPETPTFVVNDRRKFTSDGEPRHDSTAMPIEAPANIDQDQSVTATATQTPAQAVLDISTPALEQLSDLPESGVLDQSSAGSLALESADLEPAQEEVQAGLPYDDPYTAGPSAEESADALRAYEGTVDRLDTALRAADPGGERLPPMSFERLTQSLYTQALMLLGGGTQPGEQPRVDILGARQTIDMLSVVAEKTKGNLTAEEDKLMQSALFDLHMGFLEITQALARQAASRQPGTPGMPPMPGAGGGPRIVR